jgi:molybdate transport system substrate-binding protein
VKQAIAAGLTGLFLSSAVQAAEIKVISTQATEQAYREVMPIFEKTTGHKVTTVFTGTLDVEKRLASGEHFDVLIMSGPSIEQHLKDGMLAPDSRVTFGTSAGIGLAVRPGLAKPNISTLDALKKTLLDARSIGLATGPSGKYMLALFDRLGIANELKAKTKITPSGVFVGNFITSGEVDMGFQQISELARFEGIDYVGPLPDEVQEYTVFAGGVAATTKVGEAARALLNFLRSPEAVAALRRWSIKPT